MGWSAPAKAPDGYPGHGEPSPDLSIRLAPHAGTAAELTVANGGESIPRTRRPPLVAVLVRASSPAALEQARTYLATHTAPSVPGQNGNLPTPPRTIAEVVTIRTSEDTIAQRLIDAAVTLTLIVADCSLAVAVGGGLVDRKRPFTLLRVSGVPAGALSRVVLLEAALPLAAATVIAAGIAYCTSVLAESRLAAEGVAIPSPGRVYYETLGAGLAIALLIIGLTIPLLRRMSAPGKPHWSIRRCRVRPRRVRMT
jgi:hypothetical protein